MTSDATADGRRLLVERGLAARSVAALARDALSGLPYEALGPVKALLKRFFSAQQWTAGDDEALALAVGPGSGWWTEVLDDDLALGFGWKHATFRIKVVAAGAATAPAPAHVPDGAGLEATFDGPVTPEATPNPRTIVFRTGPLHEGDSRSYRSAEEAVDDPRVARLFDRFPDLATVLVARDFVALTLRRPDRWEGLLAPALEAVTEEFFVPGAATTTAALEGAVPPGVTGASARSGGAPSGGRRETRLDRAWRELGALRADEATDLERIAAAASDDDVGRRQVAAALVGAGPAEAAQRVWAALVTDTSRAVRRATVDAMVDAGRPELRLLLEQALADDDSWVRWKALRGLAELGAEASRPAIAAVATDPDFRVRLEAQAALRPPS